MHPIKTEWCIGKVNSVRNRDQKNKSMIIKKPEHKTVSKMCKSDSIPRYLDLLKSSLIGVHLLLRSTQNICKDKNKGESCLFVILGIIGQTLEAI